MILLSPSDADKSGRAILAWSAIGIAAFAVLPWKALDYGLFDALASELWDAVGWRLGAALPWLPTLACLLLALRPWRGVEPGLAFRIDAAVAAATVISLLIGSKMVGLPLGLGAAVQVVVLGGIAALAVARLGYVQGDAFMTGSILLITGLVVTFILFPISTILIKILVDAQGTFTPFRFFEIVTSAGFGRVLLNSLVLAIAVGFSTTVLGFVFALYAVRATSRFRGLIRVFSILPIITPPFVVGLALILIFGRSGTINDALLGLFGAGGLLVPEGSAGWFQRSGYIYGFAGIFLAQTLAFTPVSYLVLHGLFGTISPALEEASLTMRASDWQTFRYVTFPLLRPGIANAFLLSVIESLADFGNPLILGGDFDVLATEIYFSIVGSRLDYARAGALGLTLLTISLAIFLIQNRWIGRKSYVTVTGKGAGGHLTAMPDWMQFACGVVVYGWIAFNAVLYGSIFMGGFVVNWGADYTPTFAHHAELWLAGLGYGGWPSYLNTMKLALIAAPLTAVLGILIAYVTTRKRFVGRGLVDFGAMISFAIPGTVMGVAYILAFNVPPIQLTGTALILVISFIFRNMPVGIRTGVSALSQIDKSLEEASLTQRAGSLRTIVSVVLPLLRPAIISASVYSFIRAVTSVSAVIFLVTAQTNVSTTYILARVERGNYGVAVAYGSVLILTMLIVSMLIDHFVGRSRVQRRVAWKERKA